MKNWVTRGGSVIPINKMTDNHLYNTINYLERVKDGRLSECDLQYVNSALSSLRTEKAKRILEKSKVSFGQVTEWVHELENIINMSVMKRIEHNEMIDLLVDLSVSMSKEANVIHD